MFLTVPARAGARAEQTLVVPGQSPSGQPVLSVLLKRTYRILPNGRTVRAAADQPFHPGDVYHGKLFLSSLAFESDVVAFKPATDVVFNGRAYAPDGEPVEALHASLTVGGLGKELLIVGDRVCHYQGGFHPVFEDPVPFTEIALRYEHAYGGIDAAFDPAGVYAYPRNPVGRGFVVEASEAAIEGLLLPNIEDPADPLTPDRLVTGAFEHWEHQPMPQGFGWFAKHWQPRITLAGLMPDPSVEDADDELSWLPYMDFGFFNGASPGLVFPYLAGDELVEAVCLTPDGGMSFHLPGETPRIGLDVGQGVWEPPVVLQTVMIRLDQRELDLVWRAAVAYAGVAQLGEVRRLAVLVEP